MKTLPILDTHAGNDWGYTFTIVPRKVLNDLKSRNEKVRERALLLLHLINLSFFADGHRNIRDKSLTCRKGEIIVTFRKLEEYTGIEYSKLRRMIRKLEKEQFLSLEVTEGISKIRLIRYEKFLRRIQPKEEKQKAPATPSPGSSFHMSREQMQKNIERLNGGHKSKTQ